jgi:hypothetical protein
MQVEITLKTKFIVPAAAIVGAILLIVPASLGESSNSDPTPIACDGEMRLAADLEGVTTPRALRAKIFEAQKLVPQKGHAWLELSKIALAAKRASLKDVPALKRRLASLLQQCSKPVNPDQIDID